MSASEQRHKQIEQSLKEVYELKTSVERRQVVVVDNPVESARLKQELTDLEEKITRLESELNQLSNDNPRLTSDEELRPLVQAYLKKLYQEFAKYETVLHPIRLRTK